MIQRGRSLKTSKGVIENHIKMAFRTVLNMAIFPRPTTQEVWKIHLKISLRKLSQILWPVNSTGVPSSRESMIYSYITCFPYMDSSCQYYSLSTTLLTLSTYIFSKHPLWCRQHNPNCHSIAAASQPAHRFTVTTILWPDLTSHHIATTTSSCRHNYHSQRSNSNTQSLHSMRIAGNNWHPLIFSDIYRAPVQSVQLF